MPGTPITVDGRRRHAWQDAPIRGEHNRVVSRELLRMNDGEIDALLRAGVLRGEAVPAG